MYNRDSLDVNLHPGDVNQHRRKSNRHTGDVDRNSGMAIKGTFVRHKKYFILLIIRG